MKKIAVTGKIGTGKSVLLKQFKFLGYKTYSSDQMVRDLYAKDKHIINEIRKLNSSLILNKKIQSIEGVSRTETFISLEQQIDRQISID